MSREVRKVLYRIYKLEDDEGNPIPVGFLGYPPLVDIMTMHKHLMEIRSTSQATTSDEFLEEV